MQVSCHVSQSRDAIDCKMNLKRHDPNTVLGSWRLRTFHNRNPSHIIYHKAKPQATPQEGESEVLVLLDDPGPSDVQRAEALPQLGRRNQIRRKDTTSIVCGCVMPALSKRCNLFSFVLYPVREPNMELSRFISVCNIVASCC